MKGLKTNIVTVKVSVNETFVYSIFVGQMPKFSMFLIQSKIIIQLSLSVVDYANDKGNVCLIRKSVSSSFTA